MSQENQRSGVVDAGIEAFLQAVQKSTIGDPSSDKSALENLYELTFSNLGKIGSQVFAETLIEYSVDSGDINQAKTVLPDIAHLLSAVDEMDTIDASLQAIQRHWDGLPEHRKAADGVQDTYERWMKEQERRKLDVQQRIKQYADSHGLDIDVNDSKQAILDKAVGQGFGYKYYGYIDKLFSKAEIIKAAIDAYKLDFNDPDALKDYMGDLLGLTPLGTSFISGASSFTGFQALDNFLTTHLPTLSAKNLVGMLGRGVLVGIATDLAYQGGYQFGKWLWGDVFKAVFGKQLYDMDWFINASDSVYSTIFSHLTGDELNTTVAFNTMLLSNFTNRQGDSVIQNDVTVLLGADDYHKMDFDKVLRAYKALYQLLSGQEDAENINSAQALIAHMNSNYDLFKAQQGEVLIIPQNRQEWHSLLDAAKQDGDAGLPYRYALANLNPFVLVANDLYTEHNSNGILDKLSDGNPNGMSDVYIEKRLDMLSLLSKSTTPYDTQKTHGYLDLASGKEIDNTYIDYGTGNNGIIRSLPKVIFGTDADDTDTLHGGSGDDYLFGGAGSDTLIGGKGHDYLEGGTEFDVYIIKSNEGIDIIRDSDGKGVIIFDGKALTRDASQVKQLADNIWFDDDFTFTYRGDGRLSIQSRHEKNDASVMIENWKDGDLGLSFSNAPKSSDGEFLTDQQPVNIYKGDQRAKLIGIEIDTTVEPSDGDYNTYDWSKTQRMPDGTLLGGIDEENFADVIYARGDGSEMYGYGGNDLLHGTVNNDRIYGGDGDDYLSGVMGADWIEGGAGNDVITANGVLRTRNRLSPDDKWTPPNDAKEIFTQGPTWGTYFNSQHFIYNDHSTLKDEYQQSDEGDVLIGGSGDDKILASWNNDVIWGDAFDSKDNGADGADTIYALGGSDIIYAGGGDDYIQADGRLNVDLLNYTPIEYHGDDLVDAGDGNDHVEAGGGNDIVYGRKGKDTLIGDTLAIDGKYHGQDFLYGGEDNDSLVGLGNNDRLYGGAGNDALYGDHDDKNQLDSAFHGDDYLNGGEGNDKLTGHGGNDLLIGGMGDDKLWGDSNNKPNQQDPNWAGEDQLFGGEGNDYLDGGYGNDYLDGGTGNDVLFGGGGNDMLYSGAGDDFLYGDCYDQNQPDSAFHGDDYLNGGEGNDELIGYGGNDVLVGGMGDDKLWGDSNYEPNQQDPDWAGEDQLFGGEGNDYLDGGYGNDYLDGGTENDVLHGGAGNDMLYGGDGNDWLFGDAFNFTPNSADNNHDVIYGGNGNDVMLGGVGDDLLSGDDGNDTLVAGSGNDILIGGNGADVYRFSLEDLKAADINVINDTGQGNSDSGGVRDSIFVNDQALSSLVWVQDIANQNLWHDEENQFTLDASTENLLITVNASGAVIELTNFEDSDYGIMLQSSNTPPEVREAPEKQTLVFRQPWHWTVPANTVIDPDGDTLRYVLPKDAPEWLSVDANGTFSAEPNVLGEFTIPVTVEDGRGGSTIMNIELSVGLPPDAIQTNGFSLGTFNNDLIFGSENNDTIRGLSGNDEIFGLNGDDYLVGEMGNDTLHGGEGNDRLDGSLGNDGLFGDAGDDRLFGQWGNDTLYGGTGNDYLEGGFGDDTYHFARGDGTDVIRDSGGKDSLVLKDIRLEELLISQDGDDMTITIAGSDEKITIEQWDAWLDSGKIETLKLADATLNSSQIEHYADGKTHTLDDLQRDYGIAVI